MSGEIILLQNTALIEKLYVVTSTQGAFQERSELVNGEVECFAEAVGYVSRQVFSAIGVVNWEDPSAIDDKEAADMVFAFDDFDL